MLLTAMQLSQLRRWNNTEQMAWGGISWVDETDLHRLILISTEIQVRQRQTFARTQPNMDLFEGTLLFDSDRTTKGSEWFFARHHRMTQHQLMSSLTLEVKGDVKPDSIGADVVQC